jgi:predicted TIM-barrel fold metal-dependent hydrolase
VARTWGDEVTPPRSARLLRNIVVALLSLGGSACETIRPPATFPGAADLPLIDAHSQVNESVDLTQVIALMDRAGVQRTFLSTNGRMRPAELVAFASRYPGRIIPAVSPRIKQRGFEEPAFLERQVRTGGFGAIAEVLIYHAQKGNRVPLLTTDLDGPQVAIALGYAQQERWPLTLHIEFGAAGPRRETLMRQLESLLTQHPDQPFVLIHMGQLDPSSARSLIAAHGNVYFITSHANPIFTAKRGEGHQPWTSMFRTFGTSLSADWRELVVTRPDRFILGFDNVYPEDWGDFYLSQVRLWRGALSELPPHVAHAVAHGNAERLWRLRSSSAYRAPSSTATTASTRAIFASSGSRNYVDSAGADSYRDPLAGHGSLLTLNSDTGGGPAAAP